MVPSGAKFAIWVAEMALAIVPEPETTASSLVMFSAPVPMGEAPS